MITLFRNTQISIVNEDAEYYDFLRKIPPTRLSPNNPVIVNDGTYENICPAGITQHRSDPDKVIFYCAEFFGSISVGARISYFIVDKSAPEVLGTRQGIVLVGSESYDINGARLGCVVDDPVTGDVWYYYVGIDASYDWRICLATSTDGITFTKQGVVLDFNNIDEKSISDPSIVIFQGVWYMIYTGWDGLTSPPNNNPGESKIGIKAATSTDGITWVKLNTVLVPLGNTNTFDDNNAEGGQLLRIGKRWVILYNANDGAVWSIGMASSPYDDMTYVFSKYGAKYFADATGVAWDDYLVAVPLVYEFPSGKVMYYQALSLTSPDDIDVGMANLINTY